MGAITVDGIPLRKVVEIVRRAQQGHAATYSTRDGVVCPICHQHLKPSGSPGAGVRRTLPWAGTCRERYHECPVCGGRFKSVEG